MTPAEARKRDFLVWIDQLEEMAGSDDVGDWRWQLNEYRVMHRSAHEQGRAQGMREAVEAQDKAHDIATRIMKQE